MMAPMSLAAAWNTLNSMYTYMYIYIIGFREHTYIHTCIHISKNRCVYMYSLVGFNSLHIAKDFSTS
jgi:hypothetical protein